MSTCEEMEVLTQVLHVCNFVCRGEKRQNKIASITTCKNVETLTKNPPFLLKIAAGHTYTRNDSPPSLPSIQSCSSFVTKTDSRVRGLV